MKLQSKRAIVTGGTRGIGRAIVDELAKEGCGVVFTYHSSDELAKEIEKSHESSEGNVLVLRRMLQRRVMPKKL